MYWNFHNLMVISVWCTSC